jgi:hypothetical protein
MKKLFILATFFTLHFSILTLNCKAQWQSAGCCIGAAFCFATNGDTIFTGDPNGFGVYISPNNGNGWVQANIGLPAFPYVYALANKADTIFAGTKNSGVFLSTNGGSNWAAINIGLTNNYVRSLVIKGDSIFAGTVGSGVFLSVNNGGLWTAASLTDTVQVFAVNGNKIFAGTYSGGIYLSTNGGITWATVNTGLTNHDVSAIAIKGDTIFAGTQNGGVFLSTNNGGLWTAVNSGLTDLYINAIAINGNDIYVGTGGAFWLLGGGVFMSSNNGSNWIAINTGIISNSLYVFALAINKDTLFAGTDSIIWKRPLSQITGIEERNNKTSNIAVYPNPATSNVTIENPQHAAIEITNIQGQLIKTITTPGNKTNVDVSEFLSGVYLLKVKTEKGIEVRKFVKE